MSSKRRSYDTDEITLRKVFAKSFANNSAIPAQRVLTADGAGGTYWAIPSTLGLTGSFNQINTSAGNFTADLSYNIFTLTSQSGIGFTEGAGSNELNIYGKAFNQIDVSGNNSLYGFTNNVVTPTVKFAGIGGITVLSDPDTNTIVFASQGIQVSSSQFSFSRVQVYSNASTVRDSLASTNSVILNAASPSSILQYVGLTDILLSTNATNNVIFFGLRSTGSISTLTANVTSISTNYVKKTDFSTATTALASTSLGYYNYLSTITIAGLSTLSTAIGNASVNLSTFNLSTTNVFTSTINFNDINNGSLNTLAVSSGTLVLNGQGIVGTVEVNKTDLVSTVAGLGSAGYVSTLSTNILSTGWLKSGIAEVSTVIFKDTGNTNDYGLFSSNASLYFNNAPVGGGTVINNSNFSTSIYQVSTVSTLFAYADFVNISSVTNAFLSPQFFSSQFFSTGDLLVSSVSFKDRINNSLQYLTVNNGFLQLNTSTVSLRSDLVSTVAGLGTAGYLSSASLVSTVGGLGAAGYISTASLVSSVAGIIARGFVSTPSLVSTVGGLGAAGYVSSASLASTVGGLGAAGYISTASLVSTFAGIVATGFLSSPSLVSTVAGLGEAGYMSTASLVSTVSGLGAAGYISSLSTNVLSTGLLRAGAAEVSTLNLKDTANGNLYALNSSNAALYFNGSAVGGGGGGGDVTTANLVSTVGGLGETGYISSVQLFSTVGGLGAAGYISSTQLTSTIAGLDKVAVTRILAGTNVTITPTTGIGAVTINASGGGGGGTSFAAFSTVLMSTLSTIVNPASTTMEFLSYSTFTLDAQFYGGPPGFFLYLSTANPLAQMSSIEFKIDRFSSFIQSSANLYVGLQYNYLFSRWVAPQYINSFGDATFDFTSNVRPYIGFSTTLLLGNTPGRFIHEKYSPNVTGTNTANYAYFDSNIRAVTTGQTEAGQSNSYNRNHLLELPKTSFENLYRSTFTLYHRLEYGLCSQGQYNNNIASLPAPGAWEYTMISGFSGFSTQTAIVDVGRNNPITLYVTN